MRTKRTRISPVIAVAAGLLASATLMGSQSPAQAAAGSDRLTPGERLTAGQSIATGPNALVMQGDGNLVLYAAQGVPLWASNTAGRPGAWAIMQSDGNLVVYTAAGAPVWASNTSGRGPSTLVVQGDGNAVVYAQAGATWASGTNKQAYAVNRFPSYGWGGDQWNCLNSTWIRESRWNELARNASSGAYGIPQALPATKMASAGSDYLTNPYTQIRWGQDYIKGRYGTPCGAWSHELRYGWY